MLEAIANIIMGITKRHEPLYFDVPLQLPTTTDEAVNIWAALVSPDGRVYLMDNQEEFYEVVPGDTDPQVIEALYQRFRFLQHQYGKKERIA